MDPSAEKCLMVDTFTTDPITPKPLPFYYGTKTDKDLVFVKDPTSENPKPIFCDVEKYLVLQQIKNYFANEKFIESRNKTNPFEKIGKSIFINRAGVKLANIDAVLNFTGEVFTFDKKNSDSPLTFCDIAAGPGAFTQYIQYRYPLAKGYGMTLKKSLDWNTKALDTKRFDIYYGPDGTGDLYKNWRAFIQRVNGKVDIVMGDGGIDMDDNIDPDSFSKQEFLSSWLLITQCAVGLACTRDGGNFMVKVFDTVNLLSAQIIYVLSICFEKIIIFKPVSSRPANSERYVVCFNKQFDTDILNKAAELYNEQYYLNSIFSTELPNKFKSWLTESNNASINNQILYAEYIINDMVDRNVEIPQYQIDKFLTIWNL